MNLRSTAFIRPRGVTVSTLDSESSDRGSNPREASCIDVLAAMGVWRCEIGAWRSPIHSG